MKKFLGILVLGLLWCSTSFAADDYTLRMYQGCVKGVEYQKNENIGFAEGDFGKMMMCKTFINGWIRAAYADQMLTRGLNENFIFCFRM